MIDMGLDEAGPLRPGFSQEVPSAFRVGGFRICGFSQPRVENSVPGHGWKTVQNYCFQSQLVESEDAKG